MDHFSLLVPCGIPDRGVTSMELELGRALSVSEVQPYFESCFATVFDCKTVHAARGLVAELLADEEPLESTVPEAQPPWLHLRASRQAEEAAGAVADMLQDLDLRTVCQEAACPNIAECFGQGTATFMILGATCTRACRFCAVRHGMPQTPDEGEPERLAEAAARLALRHVVVTSVTRDDLPDRGAGQFVAAIRAIRRRLPGAAVEVLVPDFAGSSGALQAVLDARPDVMNHNVETVPRLYARVRPGAKYRRSVALLARCKALAPGMLTKSGLMLGLGERTAEVLQVLGDLREVGCDLLTLGQYLQPTEAQLPVSRYVPPQEFHWYREKAQQMGFRAVAAGPLVRSSYHAKDLSPAMKPPALQP
jgi:lipoic acid synthetase